MCLGHCRNYRELQILSKQPHCVRYKEEDSKSILNPTLNMTHDKRGHLQGAGQSVGSLGDGGLQYLDRSWGSSVGRSYLLYIGLYEGRGWMPKSLRQAS